MSSPGQGALLARLLAAMSPSVRTPPYLPNPPSSPYMQPFRGLHNEPYGSQPGMGENSVNQHPPVPNPPLAEAPPPLTSANFPAMQKPPMAGGINAASVMPQSGYAALAGPQSMGAPMNPQLPTPPRMAGLSTNNAGADQSGRTTQNGYTDQFGNWHSFATGSSA